MGRVSAGLPWRGQGWTLVAGTCSTNLGHRQQYLPTSTSQIVPKDPFAMEWPLARLDVPATFAALSRDRGGRFFFESSKSWGRSAPGFDLSSVVLQRCSASSSYSGSARAATPAFCPVVRCCQGTDLYPRKGRGPPLAWQGRSVVAEPCSTDLA
jgi:hypothetical protein